MTTLIHVGDLHFWSFVVNPFNLLNKRALGMGNLLVKRSREFKQIHAPILQEQIIKVNPDYCLFSGDFTTTSLDSEFLMAKNFIDGIKKETDSKVYLVPGNHDRYTVGNHKKKNLEKILSDVSEDVTFPFFNIIDGTGLIGIDATTKNGFGSFGLIKKDDIDTIKQWLEKNKDQLKQVIVLCHFPYEAPTALMKKDRGIQLYSGDGLLNVFKAFGLPFYFLHGHHHYRWVWQSPSCPNLTYLNAGAPLLTKKKSHPDLGFYEINLNQDSIEFKRHRCIDLKTQNWESEIFETPTDSSPISLL